VNQKGIGRGIREDINKTTEEFMTYEGVALLDLLLKWRTIRPYPVLLRTPPVSFPKTTGLFAGIAHIHGLHQGAPFYFNSLDKNQACNNR